MYFTKALIVAFLSSFALAAPVADASLVARDGCNGAARYGQCEAGRQDKQKGYSEIRQGNEDIKNGRVEAGDREIARGQREVARGQRKECNAGGHCH